MKPFDQLSSIPHEVVQDVESIVSEFYRSSINDVLIGYLFLSITDHLQDHIKKVTLFWLRNLGYLKGPKSNLFEVHKHLPLKRGEILRWRMLFYMVLDKSDTKHINKDEWKQHIDDLIKLNWPS